MPRKKYKVNVAEGERVSPNAVYDYLTQKGVPHNHALGMMANIKHESNFIPTAKGDSGTSAGLFQHHNDRYSGLKKHVNNDLRNWKGQIDYALSEGDTKNFLKSDFKSPEQASHWFTTKWERPQNAEKKAVQRQEWIKTYLDNRGQDYNQNLYNPENIDPSEESGPIACRPGNSGGMCGYTIPEDEMMKAAFKKDLAISQEEESKLGESGARQELTEEEQIKQKKKSFVEELAALRPKRKEESDIQEESTRQQPGKIYLGDESKLFQPLQAAQQRYSIEQARDGGYFGDGGKKHSFPERDLYKSKEGTVTNTITKANGDTVIQVKTKNGKYYEKLIKKSDALDTLSKLQGAVKPEFLALGNAQAETKREEKQAKQKFLNKAWSNYDDWSTSDKVSDRVGAFLNDPFGMTARAVTGNQAYIPGMAQGLHNHEDPEIRNRYLKELGYTPGEFDASDVQNMINPGYWASSFVENSRKGNVGTAALEGALMFLPHLPKGTISKSNIRSGAKMLKNDVKNAGEYLTTKTPLKEVPKELPGSNNNVTFYHGGLDPNATLDDIDLFKLAARQQKKGRDYAGFYMSPDIGEDSFALGYHLNNPSSGLHKIELPSNSKAYEYSGSMERIKKSELEKLKEQGYDYIKGKNIFGQPEFVLLNKDKARLTEVSKQLPGSPNAVNDVQKAGFLLKVVKGKSKSYRGYKIKQ